MVSENDDEDRRGQMMVRTNGGRDGRRKILQIWSLLLLRGNTDDDDGDTDDGDEEEEVVTKTKTDSSRIQV